MNFDSQGDAGQGIYTIKIGTKVKDINPKYLIPEIFVHVPVSLVQNTKLKSPNFQNEKLDLLWRGQSTISSSTVWDVKGSELKKTTDQVLWSPRLEEGCFCFLTSHLTRKTVQLNLIYSPKNWGTQIVNKCSSMTIEEYVDSSYYKKINQYCKSGAQRLLVALSGLFNVHPGRQYLTAYKRAKPYSGFVSPMMRTLQIENFIFTNQLEVGLLNDQKTKYCCCYHHCSKPNPYFNPTVHQKQMFVIKSKNAPSHNPNEANQYDYYNKYDDKSTGTKVYSHQIFTHYPLFSTISYSNSIKLDSLNNPTRILEFNLKTRKTKVSTSKKKLITDTFSILYHLRKPVNL